MNLTKIINIKERVAISSDWKPDERDFLLEAINIAVERARTAMQHDAPVEFHNPPNYLGRIDQLWAFLSVDDGGEGVCAAPLGNITATLVAADKRRVDALIPFARAIANVFQKPVRLVKFNKREDIDIYQPGEPR